MNIRTKFDDVNRSIGSKMTKSGRELGQPGIDLQADGRGEIYH